MYMYIYIPVYIYVYIVAYEFGCFAEMPTDSLIRTNCLPILEPRTSCAGETQRAIDAQPCIGPHGHGGSPAITYQAILQIARSLAQGAALKQLLHEKKTNHLSVRSHKGRVCFTE